MNHFKPQHNLDFVNEIDNPKALKKIDNLIIAALFREDRSSNGVISLFNHGSGQISEYNLNRLNAMRVLFGGCIEKIEDKTKKLTTVVSAKMNSGLVITQVQQALESIIDHGTIDALINLKKPFDYMEVEIKKDYETIYGQPIPPIHKMTEIMSHSIKEQILNFDK